MEYYHEKVQLTNRIPAMIAFLDHENIKQYFPKGAIIPEHWHRSLEVSWIQDAIVNVRSGQNERTICNDFTCINSGVVHSLSASQITESSKCTVVLISYDFIKSYYPEIDEVTFDLSLKENHDDLKRLYVRLSKLYQNQNEYTYLHVTACLLEIIALLLETYSVDKHSIKGKTSKYQKQIKQILGYLQEHYQEPLTLSSVANQFHMSKEHFSRQFHCYMGKTFHEYLANYRLYRAYNDVLNSDLPIQEVARIHGFLNIKSFIQLFKETYHDTPLQYRKKQSLKNKGE